MAIWPVCDAGLQTAIGQIASTSLWTTVTSFGTANTVGTYAQLTASTPFQVGAIWMFIAQTGLASSALNIQGLMDIGVGAAGSEVVLVSSIGVGGVGPFTGYRLPLSVPEGKRLAVRTQTATANRSCTVGMVLMGGGQGLNSASSAVTYGAVTSGSRGTILTAPASVNTDAAWTVISTAISAPMRWLMIGLCAPNTATATAADGFLDIGIGPSGQEQAIITDIPFQVSAAEQILFPQPLTFPVDIAISTRLVARYQATSTATTASPSLTITGFS